MHPLCSLGKLRHWHGVPAAAEEPEDGQSGCGASVSGATSMGAEGSQLHAVSAHAAVRTGLTRLLERPVKPAWLPAGQHWGGCAATALLPALQLCRQPALRGGKQC